LIVEKPQWEISPSLPYDIENLCQIFPAFSYCPRLLNYFEKSDFLEVAEELSEEPPIAERIIADVSVLKLLRKVGAELKSKQPIPYLSFDFICNFDVLV